ncbi:MAG TPA: hypothetical protein VE641_21565 [Chthoniobacterales bacterium]|nr:hypothetical protein [Chthoniobacterales bacterium]
MGPDLFRLSIRHWATKEDVVINSIIQEVLALALPELRRNRILLQTQLAHDLPIVVGDRIQLQQVILNLVMNPIEAMTGGEGPRDLQVISQKITEPTSRSGRASALGYASASDLKVSAEVRL